MTIKANLSLVSEQETGGVRPHGGTADARHSFAAAADPRRAGQCVKCGRGEADSIHAYVDLAHRASVSAHFSMAANHASQGDFAEAVREAKVAIRLAGLED